MNFIISIVITVIILAIVILAVISGIYYGTKGKNNNSSEFYITEDKKIIQPRIIWMCWFQGENKLEGLNKTAVSLWRYLNGDTWDIRVLDNTSIPIYLPDYNSIVESSPSRQYAARSDLLRLMLLEKYGGVWVDASVIPAWPLDTWIDSVIENSSSGFFTYRFIPRTFDRKETVNWFLAVDKPGNWLISQWLSEFKIRFKTIKPEDWHYFECHHTLTDMFDRDINVRQAIQQGMVQKSCKPINAIDKVFIRSNGPHAMYKRPKKWVLSPELSINE